jgi:hypothetical protein
MATENEKRVNMKITDFINGHVSYDEHGGTQIWINGNDGSIQMLAQVRGFGAIQNMFKRKDGTIDMEQAMAYQDMLGKWIAEAINEKLVRDTALETET